MKKAWLTFTLFLLVFSQNIWGESFTRTDFEQKKDKKLVRTTLVDVQDETISLTQNLLDDESGNLIWDETKQWPVSYKKSGHIMGERDSKKSTTLSLIFTKERLEQFASELEVDEYLKKAFQKAKEENKTKCADGLTNYEALALETSRDFSKVFQAICFK